MKSDGTFELSAEERVADICADLLSYKCNHTFVERLFRAAPGQWLALGEVCNGLDIQDRLRGLDRIWVAWLPHPAYLGALNVVEGYRTVVFYSEDPDWGSVAVYNTQATAR